METPIRILNLFTIMDRGGAESIVMNYYRHIDRSKVQFDFMVHREQRGAFDDEIEAMGGRIYRMCPIYPQNFGKYKKMLRKFFSEHPEYRIIHSHMSELGYFAFKEAKRQGVPVRICHAHNTPNGFDLKMIMRTYFKTAMKPYITHRLICGTAAGCWLFGEKYQDQFIMMNNAIDTAQYAFSPAIRAEMRRELGLENRFVVGHVGRFAEQKNHMFLLEIFAALAQKRSDAVLLLVGGGAREDEIRKRVQALGLQERVKFLGVRNDINRVMQAMDIFLFPSLFEGLPVTMVEAQTAGLPCFISESIPPQCILTENVRRISLDEPAAKWAEIILDETSLERRKDIRDIIVRAGFDITENAKWLQEFYLNEYQNSTVDGVHPGI